MLERNSARTAFFLIALLLPAGHPFRVTEAQQRRPFLISESPDPPASPAQQQRRNIGLVFDKLRAGRALTVAYIGGSTAAGLGAGNRDKSSYRVLVAEWLRKNFPKCEITEIDAAVPHTGSLYATLRARRDVIADKPDLVFVDLATSDAGEDEATVKKATEGLLRQLLVVPQPPEVVMLYATNAKRGAHVEWYDVLAGYYQVPALNLQDKTWALLDAGKTKSAELWKDGVNLSDAGHKLYAEFITSFLAEQQAMKPAPIPRTLPPPLISDELNYGEFRTFAEIPSGKSSDSHWKADPTSDRVFPTELLASNRPGAQIETYFEGTVIGLSFRAGPDAGVIECLIDGKPAPPPLARIDCYDSTHHIATRIIAGGLGPGEHKLTLRVLSEKNPRSSGTNIRLGYLLVGGTRPERL
jgi:lysophospholipase L1-like esterase